jgi:hypothetical protein
MSIRIDSINEHCETCKGLAAPNQDSYGFLRGYIHISISRISQSAKECTGCQFLQAIIGNARSSQAATIVIDDGSQGSIAEFKIDFSEYEWHSGSTRLYALQGILETLFSF